MKFEMTDGTVVEIDASEEFINYVRKVLELSTFEYVTDKHIRDVFVSAIKKASDEK